MILTSLQKLPSNVGNLGKIIVAPALNGCPKCKKSPNLVTLLTVKDIDVHFHITKVVDIGLT